MDLKMNFDKVVSHQMFSLIEQQSLMSEQLHLNQVLSLSLQLNC